MTTIAVSDRVAAPEARAPRTISHGAALMTLAKRRFALSAKTPREIVVPLLTPILFALVIAPALATMVHTTNGLDYKTYVAVGTVGLLVPLSCMFAGIGVIVDRDSGARRELLAAPVPRSLMVGGNFIVALTVSALQLAALIIAALARGAKFHTGASGIAWFIGAAFLFAVASYGIAEVMANRIPKQEEYVGATPAIAILPWFLAGSLFLAAVAVTRPWVVTAALIGLTIGACFALAAVRGALPWALLALVVVYLVVFVAWPEVNSLAAIGARPDGGGRFFGDAKLTETVLLTVSLEAAALLGGWWIAAVFVLTLVTVGWSHAGADGGGIVVLMVAFGVLAARMYDVRFTVRRVVVGGLAVVAAVAAIVGLDAATGGSSHVTHAFRRGPVSLAEELAHRIHISAASVASGWNEASVFAVSIVALVVLWTRPPRFPAGDALVAGVAVSLLVNDSPGDVASAGALSYAVLWAYERVRQPARVVARAGSVGVDAPGVTPRT